MQICMRPFQLLSAMVFGAFLPAALSAAEDAGVPLETTTSLLTDALSSGSPQFGSVIPVNTAFALNTFLDTDNNAVLIWEIQPEHYLYRDKLAVTTLEGESFTFELPPARTVTDEFFGESAVYFDKLMLQVPLAAALKPGTESINLVLHFQGCSQDRYCYPPQQRLVKLELP